MILVGSLLISGLLATSCADAEPSDRFEAFGPFLDSLMIAHGVPGVGFAVFDDRGILYEHATGVKRQPGTDPIDSETAFEAASISKPVFAYVVFSLAAQGLLDLDAPIETLVPEIPELAHDSRSGALTPRMLLTHQSGLPNWRSRLNLEARSYTELFGPDDTLRFVSDPGTEYRYSGEGYVLLQRIVEERTGKDLASLVAEIVFGPLDMTYSSVAFDAERGLNYAFGHNREGTADKWGIRAPLASSTLHTTAADLAKFGAHLASQIRGQGPYAALATPAVSVETDGTAELSWGPGLGVVDLGLSRYVYHGGNNVIFIADFIYGVDENLGYALLTNSANGQRIVEAVEHRLFGHDVPR